MFKAYLRFGITCQLTTSGDNPVVSTNSVKQSYEEINYIFFPVSLFYASICAVVSVSDFCMKIMFQKLYYNLAHFSNIVDNRSPKFTPPIPRSTTFKYLSLLLILTAHWICFIQISMPSIVILMTQKLTLTLTTGHGLLTITHSQVICQTR